MPRSARIPVELRDRPFTLADADRAGLSRRVLLSSKFRRVFHNVYVWAELEQTLQLRCRAALLLTPPGAVFSHHTAALIRELPVTDDGSIHVTVPPSARRFEVRGLVVHRRALGPDDVRVRGRPDPREPGRVDPARPSFQITAADRTFADLAGCLGLVELVVAGDAIVRAELATRDDLIAAAARPRVRGAAPARRAADLVRPRVDSPMESRLRLLLVLAGLPCPEPGRDVHDEYGDRLATVDLLYAESRIVLEYDGDLHRTKVSKWRRGQSLRQTLRDLGYDVHAFNADDVHRNPYAAVRRVHRALKRRRHPCTPERPANEWRAHFEPERELWFPDPDNHPDWAVPLDD